MLHPRPLMLAAALALSACAMPLAPAPTSKAGYHVLADIPFLQVVNLKEQINAARARVNAPPIVLDAELSNYARIQASDMVNREYFSVVAPSPLIQTGDNPPKNEPMLWKSFVTSMLSGTGWAIQDHLKILLRAVSDEPLETVWSRILNEDPDGWLVNQDDLLQIQLTWFTRMGVGIVHNDKLKVYYAVLYLADGKPSPHHFPRRPRS